MVPEGRVTAIGRDFDAPVGKGRGHHEGLPPLKPGKRGRSRRHPGHNLAPRLWKYRAEVPGFLRRTDVEPTNSTAEKAVRPLKVRQRTSGSFRTEGSAA